MFGYGTAGLRRRSTSSPGRATCTWPRPSGCCSAWSAPTPRAGPTEIAIIADDTADPEFVAADLIAQAEHDPLAACLLITTDAGLADRVDTELAPQQCRRPGTASGSPAALAGQSACVLVDDARRGAGGQRRLGAGAPGDPGRATPAGWPAGSATPGAIFVGPYAPVSLGDYLAGSNHVLPTGGTARHTGGLSVLSFLRGIHVVECDRAALAEVAPHIDALGGAEDLAAHVAPSRVRVPSGKRGQPRVRTGRLRPRCRSARPGRPARRTGRRSSTSPVRLNTNENPYPPSPALAGRSPTRSPRRRRP